MADTITTPSDGTARAVRTRATRNGRSQFSRGVVMTRTPLRLSFAGGGTDLASYYERDYGCVFSTAIAHYIYVSVKRHSEVFNEPIRLNYSRSEEVHDVEELQNDIARECLKFLEIEPPIYISTVGDMPASTGLGGSSAFAVGLLNALHAYRGERVSAGQLAEEASHIEIEVLGQPIGKQDQYAAAFGGLNLLTFHAGGGVTVQPQRVPAHQLEELFDWVMLFWTGHQRDTDSVLVEQKARTGDKLEQLTRMREQALTLQQLAHDGGLEPDVVGRMLHEGWELKRSLASRITNPHIDGWYDRAMAAGAVGGKLAGAGAGGFLLFVVEPSRQEAVRRALGDMIEVHTRHEAHGSQVVLPFMA
jgi:D-glycero-alpha-D-manno-heptose-7-phosphate kinase